MVKLYFLNWGTKKALNPPQKKKKKNNLDVMD
jgi:hypothetical protein